MKIELVEKLIFAHCSGDENQFSYVVDRLVKDEEEKGNIPAASRLRRAYRRMPKSDALRKSSASFSSREGGIGVPRDKDSFLDLYELLDSDISLSDVVLKEGQRTLLETIIEEQKNADVLRRHGMNPVNRVLFCGPPGCGKTMTAYALGNELGLPIAYVRLDGLVSSYLGQTSINLRKVFDSVKDRRIMLFLDEFDAIAKKRDDSNELGELKRVVTTLLQNFDALPSNVFLVAATNHEHLLDPAIWRRFNAVIAMSYPDEEERLSLLEKGFSRHGVKGDIDKRRIVKLTKGMSGALIDELIVSIAKKSLINGEVSTDEVCKILVRQKTKYSDEGEETIAAISEMIDSGVSFRMAADALGIPHSTLQYRIQKYRENKNNGNGK